MEARKPTEEEIQKAIAWPTWEKEPSEFDWQYEEQETCYITDGVATITAENGERLTISAGDWVTFESGLKCTWKIEKHIKKHYTFGNVV